MADHEDKAKKRQQLRDKNVDLSIIGNGFVRLYHKESVLDYDIKLLEDKSYEIIEFEGNFLSNKTELHYDLQQKLNFPDYYGKNFDALNDCLYDYEVHQNGTVIVFRHLNYLDEWSITMLLDIFAFQGRRKFAHGKKLLVLVQIDDRNFKITEPIGAINLYLLNDKER
ncbi:barstar family protein [Bernardetia sp.]|uniref:barstar family protein n=1 Tax=Bernardetia sp. TaxID=1937974 RepID=UPI0025C35A7E|nr:barstar family protein [Bernardetia sp.]